VAPVMNLANLALPGNNLSVQNPGLRKIAIVFLSPGA